MGELGNKYAIGNNGGRPPKFESPEDLEEAVNNYFENEDALSVTGLALSLGFDSRQSLYDYAEKDEFSYIIKRAKLVIENNYENCLLNASPTGAIFALKNMGWKDKQELDHTTKGESINHISLGKGVDPNGATN